MRLRPQLALPLGTLMLIITACSQGPGPSPDTPELRLEKAREMARVEIAGGGLDMALDLGAELGVEAAGVNLEATLGRELTGEERAAAAAIIRATIAEFLTPEAWTEAVAGVYAAHFSPDELDAAIEFYSSPTGAKILSLHATLNDDVGAATEAILGADLEAFISRVDEALAARFPELKETS